VVKIATIFHDMETQSAEASKPVIKAPKFVQAVNSPLLLFGVLLLVDRAIAGWRSGHWLNLINGITLLIIVMWIGSGLLNLQKTSWWITVIVGGLMWMRCLVGAVAWSLRASRGLAPDVWLLVFYILSLIILGFVVMRLLQQESRAAFGIGKPTSD
jgi:hypothetical protein